MLHEKAELNDVDAARALAEGVSSATQMEELQMAFEGTLSLEDNLNFEEDGEARYYGPASSRLEFGGSGKRPSPSITMSPNHAHSPHIQITIQHPIH